MRFEDTVAQFGDGGEQQRVDSRGSFAKIRKSLDRGDGHAVGRKGRLGHSRWHGDAPYTSPRSWLSLLCRTLKGWGGARGWAKDAGLAWPPARGWPHQAASGAPQARLFAKKIRQARFGMVDGHLFASAGNASIFLARRLRSGVKTERGAKSREVAMDGRSRPGIAAVANGRDHSQVTPGGSAPEG